MCWSRPVSLSIYSSDQPLRHVLGDRCNDAPIHSQTPPLASDHGHSDVYDSIRQTATVDRTCRVHGMKIRRQLQNLVVEANGVVGSDRRQTETANRTWRTETLFAQYRRSRANVSPSLESTCGTAHSRYQTRSKSRRFADRSQPRISATPSLKIRSAFAVNFTPTAAYSRTVKFRWIPDSRITIRWIMSQPNPYDSPEELSVPTSPETPPANAPLARFVEYTIAILLIVAMIWGFVELIS